VLIRLQVMTRKGIHRSFLSATKKWFGGSKPTNPAVITNNTNVMYVFIVTSVNTSNVNTRSYSYYIHYGNGLTSEKIHD